MFGKFGRIRAQRGLLALLAASTVLAVPAYAQDAAAPAAPVAAASDSAMVNLVRLLVEQGVLKQDKGDALLRQAETEAAAVRAGKPVELAAPGAGTIRVPYIPETVRQQIKDELRAEVLGQAKTEGWAWKEQAAPEWTKRITISGDLRIRSQSDLFAKTNSDQIFDFARINAIGPFDVSGAKPFPFLNTREDKWNQLRLRARLGVEAKVTDKVKVGFQIATGDDNSPISTNSLLAGGFGKRDLWLQLGYLEAKPTDWATLTFGRMNNPFESTDLLFDHDVSFDGVAARVDAGKFVGDNVELAVQGGVFPLDFGNANYPSTANTKTKFPQKYLLSAEVVAGAKIGDNVDIKVSAAYHDFAHVQGQLSAPCLTAEGVTDCSTDGARPFFLRKGNTLSYLRQIATRNVPNPPLLQFFGQTFAYRILDFNALASFPLTDDITVGIRGNYLRNIGFKRSDICRNGVDGEPFNNGGTTGIATVPTICGGDPKASKFNGGNQGYLGAISFGHKKISKWGDWQFEAGYRRLESDAVLDSLTDSDFHLGGTNYKGYFIGGKIGLYDGMSLGARWMSANEISGEPLGIDVLQIDLEVKF
jgi:Putative porin